MYDQLNPKPSFTDFNLDINVANGEKLPYLGYIEATFTVPSHNNKSFDLPVVVVPATDYNRKVPVIADTNFIRSCRQMTETVDSIIPKAWDTAFTNITDVVVGTVKCTQAFTLHPYEVKTVTGFIRKREHIPSAVTEACWSGHCSSRVQICPRVVSLNNVGRTAWIPVRVFNMSSKTVTIPRKANLCDLHEVKVVRSADIAQTNEETEHDANTDSEPLKADSNVQQVKKSEQ